MPPIGQNAETAARATTCEHSMIQTTASMLQPYETSLAALLPSAAESMGSACDRHSRVRGLDHQFCLPPLLRLCVYLGAGSFLALWVLRHHDSRRCRKQLCLAAYLLFCQTTRLHRQPRFRVVSVPGNRRPDPFHRTGLELVVPARPLNPRTRPCNDMRNRRRR